MEIRDDKWDVATIIEARRKKRLIPNDEYQRGLAWKPKQKIKFVDSVFRGYPIPPLILHEKSETDSYGTTFRAHEIIDGQQRVNALFAYQNSEWEIPAATNRRYPLPKGVIDAMPNPPWTKRRYTALPPEVKQAFDKRKIDVLMVTSVTHPDEIRDLFVRLQGGTALTRQQVRDAWPGPIAQYVVDLAGRIVGDTKKQPKFNLFTWVGRWGRRMPEGADPDQDVYHDDRQTCAQMLRIFLEREHLPPDGTFPPMPSLSAESIDEMYHTKTDFDRNGIPAQRFEKILGLCEEAIVNGAPPNSSYVRKSMLFSTFSFFEDLTRHPSAAVNAPLVAKIGKAIWSQRGEKDEPSGPVSSSEFLAEHYSWFCRKKMESVEIKWLHSERGFSEAMKDQIWKAAVKESPGGLPVCAACDGSVSRSEAEFDHKTPWVLGGPTTPANGRVLHKKCNRSLGGSLSGVSR